MRVHIFDPQLGRGPGHPPVCDEVVADELERRGIPVDLYGAKNPVDDSPAALRAIQLFGGAMWDHVGRDPLVWALEDYSLLGEQFAHDLSAVPQESISSEDIAYFPNLTQNQIAGIRKWVLDLPVNRRPTLVLKFSVLTYATPQFQEYRNKNLIPLLYRFGMRSLLSVHPRTVICTDSEEMASAFGGISEMTLPVLPLPLCIGPGAKREEGPLTIAYLGYASPWKGFQLLPEIVSQSLQAARAENTRAFHFVIQSFGEDKLCSEVEGALQHHPEVKIIRGDVDRDTYVRLLQGVDILLMPYASMIYGWASSGIFTEALSAGKVVVVPEQTWLARQLAEFRAGGVTFASQETGQIVTALLRALADYPALSARATAAITAWSARHCPAAFVDQFLILAKMVSA